MTEFHVTRSSLLLRIRNAQDESAWGEFVEIYSPLVYGFARKQGLQDADAIDVTQDVLRIVSRTIGRLDYDPLRGSFRGWLFTIVRNELKDWFSKQRSSVMGTDGSKNCPHWKASSRRYGTRNIKNGFSNGRLNVFAARFRNQHGEHSGRQLLMAEVARMSPTNWGCRLLPCISQKAE